MMLEVAKERIEEAVRTSSCEAVKMVPCEALDVMLDSLEQTVSIGIGPAAKLTSTYRHRYESIKEFREESFGWRGFFNVLSESEESVGLLAVRGGGWRMILLLNESSASVVASLVRPPSRADWPEGASAI
ncbi:hypothetical protein ACGF12_22295 [Kitasatospora sp. NPDC048296]|uniref:hypothetical protein n=1 Tax=Kitasatospora sp. NPDC048296 TaxID=3364048 RepID=UPI00372235B5